MAENVETPQVKAPRRKLHPKTAALKRKQPDGVSSPRPPKPEPKIKTEQSATPRHLSPTPSSATVETSVDEATAKAIAAAQNEYSTRRVPKKPIIDKLPSPDADPLASPVAEDDVKTPAGEDTSITTTSRKRSAPKNSASNVKTAANGIKKPPPKKRKLDATASEDRATPGSANRSATPASTTTTSTRGGRGGTASGKASSRKASLAGTPASSSPAPAAGSPAPASSEPGSDMEDSAEVYCICRRPDNHTWMVACDGGCDDWFHGKCVDVAKEDQDLIDKYICPNCTAGGRGVTTWKPMCRREGCRRPARLRKAAPSKYCSDECGVTFMVAKTEAARIAAAKVLARANDDDEPDLGPLGGALRAHELKALAFAAPDSTTFRNLGNSPMLVQAATNSPETGTTHAQHAPIDPPTDPLSAVTTHNPHSAVTPTADSTHLPALSATATAASRLAAIADRKSFLRARRALLKDRDRFVALAKERAARLVAATKQKDLCAYDTRLSWDDTTFREWREDGEGTAAFAQNTLDVDVDGDADGAAGASAVVKIEGDGAASPPVSKKRPQPPHRTSTSELATGGGVVGGAGDVCCMRRRCQRHAGWQKLALHDVRFEEAETRAEMRKVDEEEKEIRGGMAFGGLDGAGMAAAVAGGEDAVDGDGVAGVEGVSEGMGGTVEVVEG